MKSYVPGKCHICKEEKDVSYCGACEHWFCEECKVKWWHRGYEAIKQLLIGAEPGCCWGLR